MLLPSALPFTTKQVGPRVNSWGRESSVDIICKPKQGGGGEQTKTHKNPCLQLCTQSQGPGGVARKQGLCGGGSVCKCHVCMYAIHGLFNSTVHRGVETKITKVQLATGSNVLWRQIEGGTPGKAPRLFRKGARVCYRFLGGFPPHASSEASICSPFCKLLIHSISVSGWLNVFRSSIFFPSDLCKNMAS